MSSEYFWQGGRKILIEQAEQEITVEAPDASAVRSTASQSGVTLEKLEEVGAGLVRATIRGDRDQSMEQLRQNSVVHHVYHGLGEASSEYLITDTFFIKFKPETTQETIDEFLQNEKLELLQDIGQKTLLVRVTDATNRNPIKTANLAAARADVEYAEPNLVNQIQKFSFIPADPLFPQQWHLHAPNDVPPDLVASSGIFAPEAWETTLGSRDIVICVADDGFDLTHPDFQGEGKVVGKLNAFLTVGRMVSYNDQVQPLTSQEDYHGTPCAGVALAEVNGQGTVGVAPGCAFLPVRFPITSFDDAAMIQLFRRISREADIVSCSWGVGPGDSPLSRAFYDVLSELARTGGRRGKGLVICVAAGNNNCPIKDQGNTKPYRFRGQNRRIRTYSGPIDRWIAAHPDVILVSGATSLKTRSAYSSWGKEVCVCAPTNNFDDLEQFTPRGLGIKTTDNEPFGLGFTDGDRYTDQFGGTSSATPTVAGVCGLILSQNPNLTAKEVKQILQDTADKDLKIESETSVNEPGDFINGFSLWFGHGKVNAAKAVKTAMPATETTIDETITANLEIPDSNTPVFSKLDLSQTGVISELRIGIDITHSFIGDLRIELMTPDGTSVILHNREGGSANDIRRIYTVTERPALGALVGKSMQGTWSIRIVDTWKIDAGRLNSWRFLAKANPLT
jgi:subtilisin family serine protease